MAHEIYENDSLALSKTRAWHGLGNVLPETFTPAEVLQVAGLDWKVEARPCYLADGRQVPNTVANCRSDDGTYLGTVTHAYEALQNEQLAQLVADVCGNDVPLESAGSLRRGQDVFILAQLQPFDAVRGDRVNRYALFSNNHGGIKKAKILPTSVRVVCANTLSMALRGVRSDVLTLRHTAGIHDAIEDAKRTLGLAEAMGEEFADVAQQLGREQWSARQTEQFFAQAYEKANGVLIPTNPQNAQEERQQRRAVATVGEWIALLHGEKNQLPAMRGTAWAALNAVTEWSDHKRTVRVVGASTNDERQQLRDDARATSNWLGSSAAFKSTALDVAMELAQ